MTHGFVFIFSYKPLSVSSKSNRIEKKKPVVYAENLRKRVIFFEILKFFREIKTELMLYKLVQAE